MFTLREFVELGLPQFPDRTSPRSSSSRTQAAFARTFASLEDWPEWGAQVETFVRDLDNSNRVHADFRPYAPVGDPPADEGAIRSVLLFVFQQINNVAASELNMRMKYVLGGSGRSFSSTDALILDREMSDPSLQTSLSTGGRTTSAGSSGAGSSFSRAGGAGLSGQGVKYEPSCRVFADIEVKGTWQFSLNDGESIIQALANSSHPEELMHSIQQLYGDMIMDEAGYGILTNYEQTLFFRRSSNVTDKTLQVSPTVFSRESPMKCFLFFLNQVELNFAVKGQLPRARVPVTPTPGYQLLLPITNVVTTSRGRVAATRPRVIMVKASAKKRKRGPYVQMDLERVDVSPSINLRGLQTFSIAGLGLTGEVIGLGAYGNILEGVVQSFTIALKTYDLRKPGAEEAFLRELSAYKQLKSLQGNVCPILYAVGQIVHCGWPFIALSYEGRPIAAQESLSREKKTEAKERLQLIHKHGVLHNDVSLKNMVISEDGWIMFVDFGRALVDIDNAASFMDRELVRLERLLDL